MSGHIAGSPAGIDWFFGGDGFGAPDTGRPGGIDVLSLGLERDWRDGAQGDARQSGLFIILRPVGTKPVAA